MFQNISISSKEVNFDASDKISINQNFTWNKHNLIIFLTNTITVLSVNVLVLLWLKIKELVCLSLSILEKQAEKLKSCEMKEE